MLDFDPSKGNLSLFALNLPCLFQDFLMNSFAAPLLERRPLAAFDQRLESHDFPRRERLVEDFRPPFYLLDRGLVQEKKLRKKGKTTEVTQFPRNKMTPIYSSVIFLFFEILVGKQSISPTHRLSFPDQTSQSRSFPPEITQTKRLGTGEFRTYSRTTRIRILHRLPCQVGICLF